MTLRTICDGGINWNWYLQGEFNEQEKTVHIFFYDRWHKFDQPYHPDHESGARMTIMEDDKRTVYGIRLNNIEYLVLNPANVFSYRDFTLLALEK